MKEDDESQEVRPEQEAEEEPQVYDVKKGPVGWRFSRRDFLAAAAAAAAAATAAAVGAGDKSREVTAEPIQVLDDPTGLGVIDLNPGELFTKVWRFKNNTDTAWGAGKKLLLVGGDQVQAPASVPVPNAAPGEIVSVSVDMVAPKEPGYYQLNWLLQVTGTLTYTSYLPIVVKGFVPPTPIPTSTPTPPACLAESPHPYQNNMSQTWVVINQDPGAQGTRVHFSRVEVESSLDYIILKDSTGQEYQRITGSYPTGLWSNAVPGRTVQVQLVTDSQVTMWGFCVDRIETAAYPPTATRIPTHTPTRTSTPCSCVGYCSGHCPGHCTCNPVCTCVPVHYWYPC
jgi:hypothetical protein